MVPDLEEALPSIWAGLPSAQTAKSLWSLLSMAVRSAMHGGDGMVEARSQKSHIHDNGFLKLNLYDTSDHRFRIRLHIWDVEVVAAEEVNVHDHRYDFASLIVSGSIENVRWRRGPNGATFKSFIYRPRDGEGQYQLEKQGSAVLAPQPAKSYSVGEWYRMDRSELHTARAAAGARTVTMCVQDRRMLKPYARTYSTFHPDDASRVDAPPLSAAEYLATLRDVVQRDLPNPMR